MIQGGDAKLKKWCFVFRQVLFRTVFIEVCTSVSFIEKLDKLFK